MGRDKITLIADPEVAPFGAWLEQLIAESSGKLGKGILPVNGEPIATPKLYGNDRLFVYLWCNGKYDKAVKRLLKAGHPVIKADLSDKYGLGAEFYRWEVAIAIACSILGVNAYDQPDVQDSKNRTIAKITYYQKNGAFDENKPSWEKAGVRIYGKVPSGVQTLAEAVKNFLGNGRPSDYVAINAFIRRDRRNEAILQKLRVGIRSKTKLATTLGFGPRFLHSTGQLHKGGANNGLFLVITVDPTTDAKIPRQGISFGALEHGQALGDLEALQARGRRVLHIHLAKLGLLKVLVDQISK